MTKTRSVATQSFLIPAKTIFDYATVQPAGGAIRLILADPPMDAAGKPRPTEHATIGAFNN